MSADGDLDHCDIAVLVPQASSAAALFLLGDHEDRPRLPTVRTEIDPPVRRVLDAAEAELGWTIVPLRVRTIEMTPDYRATAILVESREVSSPPPSGYAWADLSRAVSTRLEPEWLCTAVTGYIDERDTGWSPRRPPFSQPRWFEQAAGWMVEQMAAAGMTVIAPPQVHHLWDISAVLRATSDRGDCFLKASADVFRHEAAVTRGLADRLPGLVPDVVSIDSDAGWLLMRDLQAPILGDLDQSAWGAGLDTLATAQQTFLGRSGGLEGAGLTVRSLSALADDIAALAGDETLMAALGPEHQQAWRDASPDLVAACLRLEAIGPGPTLVHGDFHPWNVVLDERGARIFDWTDAAIGHPFVDLVTYVTRTSSLETRRELTTRYLTRWENHVTPAELQEAAHLALVVGALYQIQSYRRFLPTLPADSELAGGDADWMRQALRLQSTHA